MTAPGPAEPSAAPAPSGVGSPSGGPEGVPPPPKGPGVVPPFAAPPIEGRTLRLWLGIGSAALGVLLFCGGGAVLITALAVSATGAVREQTRVVVSDYFDAVSEGRYGDAYRLLCDDAQRRESRREFEQRVSAEPDIADYRVGDAQITDRVTVPVDVTYSDGGRDRLDVLMAQDSNTGEWEVCEIR